MMSSRGKPDLPLPAGSRLDAGLGAFRGLVRRQRKQARRQEQPLQQPPTPRIHPVALSAALGHLSLEDGGRSDKPSDKTPPSSGAQQDIQTLLPSETSFASRMAALYQQQQDSLDAMSDEVKSQCRISVMALFPDIDPKYLTQLCDEALWNPDSVIEQILNQQEDGVEYPRALKTDNVKKRKRQDDDAPTSSQELVKKWDNLERRQTPRDQSYHKTRFDLSP